MKYTEILKLKQMLELTEIPFEFTELFGGYQIGYPTLPGKNDTCVCSIIQHEFSYGSHKNKLEIMGLLTDEESENDSVIGYLDAIDVFLRIAKHFKSQSFGTFSYFRLSQSK